MTGPSREEESPELVVVAAPSGRDAELTVQLLDGAGLACTTAASVEEVCAAMSRSAVALLDERILDAAALARLRTAVLAQAEWSDFPFVVFGTQVRSSRRDELDELALLGNITLLDRPVHVRAMVFAVKSAIRARRRQYQARRAIERREQFLAMLGHELRNPLGAIRLALETMPEAPSRQRAILDRQSAHLTRLVDDLLDVARVTHGKVALQRSRVDLAEILRSCVAQHQASAERNGLDYRLVAPAEPCWTSGDRLRLEQIFNNLLTNAIKFTPRGGSVVVELETDGDGATVRVRDSGSGIAPETLPHVFELFSQADATLDRSKGGLGLGLTVVKELVGLHGGAVEAASGGLGLGAELTVRLPLALLPPAEPSARTLPESAARRIVIVDDNPDLREMLELLLTTLGHEVSTAEDGPSGVERILAVAPAIAFVDIGLPGFDGYVLAEKVRAARRSTPLVAVSGYGQAEDRARAIRAGFDEHLKKPVGANELAAMLERFAGAGASPSH